MVRVHTVSNVASVQNEQAVRYLSYEKPVGGAVHQVPTLAPVRARPVSVSEHGSLPQPAGSGLFDARPEPIFRKPPIFNEALFAAILLRFVLALFARVAAEAFPAVVAWDGYNYSHIYSAEVSKA